MTNHNIFVNPETQLLFSTSGSQSSIAKHNKALQSLSANLTYISFAHKISPEEYAGMLKAPLSRGGAVTGQGLKSGIIPFLDKIEELAQVTNAVNTVVNNNGILHGFNTDAYGFEMAIKQNIEKSGIVIDTAVIYGNGGVSGVASHVLKKLGIKITMAGRNKERVSSKMNELNLSYFEGPYDLVVNATPLSTFTLESAVGFMEVVEDTKMVFDHNMPEKENKTNYLKEYCEQQSIHFIPGNDMYVPQMIQQWKLFLNGAMDLHGNKLNVTEKDIINHWNLK